jgi:vang-like
LLCSQDDNWGENTTAVTGNTSDQSGSVEEISLWPSDPDSGIVFACSRYVGTILTIVLSVVAFLSPIAMLILPKLGM